MRLFLHALEREVDNLNDQWVRLHVVGDMSRFEPRLQALIADAQARTAHNDRLHLSVAANYGGRWDILQATRAMLSQHPELARDPQGIDETHLASYLRSEERRVGQECGRTFTTPWPPPHQKQ